MTVQSVSADGQAIALACTSLALGGDRSLKPLTPTDWHELSKTMGPAQIRPRDLIGSNASDLRDALGIKAPQAERLAGLLSRGGQLALEVERLAGRGIWIVTRADDEYPQTLKKRLGRTTPPVLFGAGPRAPLQLPAIAIVGSRDATEDGLDFASALAQQCAAQGFVVVSGAARGIDLTAMAAATSRGGVAVGVTVEPLERLVGNRNLRSPISEELLTLITPFHPAARWHAGNAMRRNRLIYTIAQAAVVVASSAENGGTRSGALENLKAGWVPLHVWDDGSPGNRLLITEGAAPLRATVSAEEVDVEQLTRPIRDSLLDAGCLLGKTTKDSDPATEAFHAIWPILAEQLGKPLGEREIAKRLDLQLSQARAWLKRASEEELVDVQTRPKRYVLRDGDAAQMSIEDAA